MTERNADIRARLLATFQVEAEEHLQAIAADFSALERGLPPSQAREVVEAAFREMHTLKGAARSVGLSNVEAICGACESLLSRMARGHLPIGRPLLGLLQEAADAVARLVGGGGEPLPLGDLVDRMDRASAESAAEAQAPAEAPEPPPAEPGARGIVAQVSDIIRVDAAKLDSLFVQGEALLVSKLAAGERVREARAFVEALSGCLAALKGDSHRGPSGAPAGAPAREAAAESALRAAVARAREMLARAVQDERAIAGAVDGLLEKRLDGFGEIFRVLSFQEIGSRAMASRAVAGLAGRTLVFVMPGSSKAVRLAMEKLIVPELGHLLGELCKEP